MGMGCTHDEGGLGGSSCGKESVGVLQSILIIGKCPGRALVGGGDFSKGEICVELKVSATEPRGREGE